MLPQKCRLLGKKLYKLFKRALLEVIPFYLYQRILWVSPLSLPISMCFLPICPNSDLFYTPKVKRNCTFIPLLGRCSFEISCKSYFREVSNVLVCDMLYLYRSIYFSFVGKTSHLVSQAFLLHVYIENLIKLFNLYIPMSWIKNAARKDLPM